MDRKEKAKRNREKRQEPVNIPFSTMLTNRLADMRKSAEQEKTDAAKMQKYYALTDVFKSIGQLGGTAVGGAIGGNMADSAPAVDPYKESRGYLEAFEKAKKANDRIKDLDEKGFSLLLRDEERAYNKAMADEERAYKEKMQALDWEYQKDFYDFKSKIDQAIAQGNMELQAKLTAERDKALAEIQAIRDKENREHEIRLKNLGLEITKIQMGLSDGKGNDISSDVDFAFYVDGVKPAKISKKRYEEMLSYFAGKGKIGDTTVDEENVEAVLRSHPEEAKKYLDLYGEGGDIVIPEKPVEDTPKGPYRPDKTKFYGYGNGYIPSNIGKPETNIDEFGAEWE